LQVARDLKESTRKLGRQLKENPDVDGNAQEIKKQKGDLIILVKELKREMEELSYSNFYAKIEKELQSQNEFD